MQIEELPKTEVKDELSETQKEDLFTAIVRGKDVTEEIETSRGKFKVKFPRMKDIEAIGRLSAARLNGLEVQSFGLEVYNLIQKIATLDIIVVSGPAWYENAKKENGFTWGDIPSADFVSEVYAKAYDFRIKVQNSFESDKGKGNSGLAADKNVSVSTEPGLFDGLSGQS